MPGIDLDRLHFINQCIGLTWLTGFIGEGLLASLKIKKFTQSPKSHSRKLKGCGFEQLESRILLTSDPLILPTTDQISASIEGQVVIASEAPCSLDIAPHGISNVAVNLLNESGQILEKINSGPNGNYSFQNLIPGVYAVQYNAPSGYAAHGASIGTGGGIKLSPSLLGEIIISESGILQDYVFCAMATSELEELTDQHSQSIVNHANSNNDSDLALPNLSFFLERSDNSNRDNPVEPITAIPQVYIPQELPEQIDLVPQNSTYGGSSRDIRDSNELDELFRSLAAQIAFDPYEILAKETAEEGDSENPSDDEQEVATAAIDQAIGYSVLPKHEEHISFGNREYYIATRPNATE